MPKEKTSPKPKPSSPTNKNKTNNTIWWILGICILIPVILVIIGAVAIFAGGYFISQNIPEIKPKDIEKEFFDNIENEFGNKFDKELEDELKKLEKELKDLEEGLDDIDKDGSAQPPAPALQVGTIEGNLSYPSEQIPDLTVCAEDTGGASSPYCTNSLINDLKYTAGRGYQLEVPPGDYYVYSYFIDPTYTAYYTEFVTCGMNVGCLSHNKITVTVANGDHHRNIDPVDWYMGP